jgi:hypothetical protein
MRIFYLLPILTIIILATISTSHAAITDCKNGYKFNRNSGVGCQQINCNDIPDAHYSYTGSCICGTSGSINEKATDPNKACRYGNDHTSCPGCVYACVHLDEKCPDEINESDSFPELNNPPPTQVEIPSTISSPPTPAAVPPTAVPANRPTQTNLSSGGIIPTPSATANNGMTCQKFCAKLTRGGLFDEILKAEGIYPNCNCVVDNKDDNNRLTQTVTQNGDIRTTYTYDSLTGQIIKKNTISIMAERERIRELLGFKYNEEQIDALLNDEAVNQWFENKMNSIETSTNMFTPAFWWQHLIALLDHGHGNSADFVDVHNYGRCGDSMEWLERNFADELKLTGKHDKKSEVMLSITGEKYGNILNHTALIIRPSGYSNIEWGDAVQELMDKTRSGGLTKNDLLYMDSRLLDAKVLDPYFKKITTVREFIKGWSVIKIS